MTDKAATEYGVRKDGRPDRRTTLGRHLTPQRGTKDIVAEAREAFAAYRGLGKDIIEDLIDEILSLRGGAAVIEHEATAKERERCAQIAERVRQCPFADGKGPLNIKAEDPCPVCGGDEHTSATLCQSAATEIRREPKP